MSLSLSLNNALSGLRANQQAISTLSHNIANANTEGYSRQVVEQSAQYIAGVGNGVRLDDVVRKVDRYLQRAVQTQGSEVGRTTVVNDYYERLNVILGQPGAQNTLDEFVTGFFNSLQALAETPDRTSARSNALGAASALADTVSGIAFDLEDLRFEADRDIRVAVDSINGLIKRLDTLNAAITSGAGLGQSVAGLLDDRDSALRELSGFLDISTSFDGAGAVNVIAGDGVALVDGSPHQLRYISTASASQFINDNNLNPLQIFNVDANGQLVGSGTALISGGTTGNITSTLRGGSIEGLRRMRDEILPAMLAQLDQLSANLRDTVNAVHNDGSGFPAASSLTATRNVAASTENNWLGAVRIAVLRKDGSPVPSPYASESYTGVRPLNLNLGALDSGSGKGRPSLQTIVDEINNHFTPPPKTSLGNLNNIRLVADSDRLITGVGSTFNFDFDVENISGKNASFFLGGITVTNDLGTDITNVTQPPPRLLLDPSAAYYTTAGLPDVTLNFLSPPGIKVGDVIFVGPPAGADVGGIPAADITGYFTVQAVGGNSVTFFANSPAASTGDVADASGAYVQTAYQTIAPGGFTRTRDAGEIQLDFGASPSSAFYDVTVSIATFDAQGAIRTSNVTYRITNGKTALLNDRFDAIAATGDAVQEVPLTTQNPLRAVLVDADGVELHKQDGRYLDQSPSYLKIFSQNADYTVVIDELDSREQGDLLADPPVQGSNRGFSHYFGLNDFFEPNEATATGDTLRNSAINLQVSQRLIDNPNLVTTGDLVLQRQPTDANAPPQYTYVRYSGDNQLAARLKAISAQTISFDAAGGLPASGLTFGGYTSELLGFIAARSASASDDAQGAQTLLDGFQSRADAISGVNLDEELANTVIFQNSYSATARIVTVVNQMFEDILQLV